MDQRFNKTDLEIAGLKGRMPLLQWMMGFSLALVVTVFLLILRGVI